MEPPKLLLKSQHCLPPWSHDYIQQLNHICSHLQHHVVTTTAIYNVLARNWHLLLITNKKRLIEKNGFSYNYDTCLTAMKINVCRIDPVTRWPTLQLLQLITLISRLNYSCNLSTTCTHYPSEAIKRDRFTSVINQRYLSFFPSSHLESG